MEAIVIKPEREYKMVEYIHCVIILLSVTVCIVPLILFIPDIEGKIIFGVLYGLFLVFLAAVAAWIPAYYNTLEYSIDREAVRMRHGVFWKKHVTVPYHKITNVDVSQGPIQRQYGLGTVHVQTAGAGGSQGGKAELKMLGIREYDRLKDIVMEGVKTHNTHQPAREASSVSEQTLLQNILRELQAIRTLLKQ